MRIRIENTMLKLRCTLTQLASCNQPLPNSYAGDESRRLCFPDSLRIPREGGLHGVQILQGCRFQVRSAYRVESVILNQNNGKTVDGRSPATAAGRRSISVPRRPACRISGHS